VTGTETASATVTYTQTFSATPSLTRSVTGTDTSSATVTYTQTLSATSSQTRSVTGSPTQTESPTPTSTVSRTLTETGTRTASPTVSRTDTATPSPTPTTVQAGPRLIGYLPDYDGSYASFATSLNFSKMTYLDICSALPPACGGACTSGSNMAFSLAQTDADIATLVNAAHAAGVKVMVSIGGGDETLDDQISAFYNAGLSAQLVSSLDGYVTSHNLDGVDVDFEDPANMGTPYATFVADLIAKEHAGGRVVSAAVANWIQTQGVMTNATLQSFDFINVMVYSNLTDCQNDMAYFASLGEPVGKMVLGVPFFGQAASGDAETFATILAAYPNAGASNTVSGGALDGGEAFTYVGDSEMAQETQLGVTYGGVMIWELSQDAAPPNSLLAIIRNNL
jgi:chitinase